ncbi:MAG: AtuA-related protein, partial [Candidatus Binatia bacterium]
WPTLVPRELMTARIQVEGGKSSAPFEMPMRLEAAREPTASAISMAPPRASIRNPRHDTRHARLLSIAYARSGDKGDSANIGVAARSQAAYEFLCSALTADVVADYYRSLCKGGVVRYELPNLRALNFVLKEALGGGGTLSLRVDHQGKTLAQGLLRMELDVPVEVFESVKLEALRGA